MKHASVEFPNKPTCSLPTHHQALRANFERRFQELGVALGVWPPPIPVLVAAANLGKGKVVRMILPDKRTLDGTGKRRSASSPLLCIIQKGDVRLDVLLRATGYMPLHVLVTCDRSQNIDAERLELTLELLRGLGSRFTGLFNRAGLTCDSFHAQIFKEHTPLRRAIQSQHARNHWITIAHDIEGAILVDWPASAVVFRGAKAALVAQYAVCATTRILSEKLTYDLTFHFSDGNYFVVVFTRNSSSDDEWPSYSRRRKELGKFGALEQSGIVVCVRREQTFRRLAADPGQLAKRYEDALVGLGARDVLSSLLASCDNSTW